MVVAAIASVGGFLRLVQAETAPDFAREVRPILSNYCFKCHGPDEKSRKGDLRLDIQEAAIGVGESGERALVPGHPEQSEVIRRILSTDRDDIMPPPSTKHELTSAQKEILRRWVASGATYTAHWAFVAPKEIQPPRVSQMEWTKNPIDQFVRAKLESEKLAPAREAGRPALIRRLSLDLVGLPPTPEEVDDFLQDPAADAYERLVERLLSSPHYGERWARKWLDLARYADTNGYEKDRNREIWPYRDWVIRALNADMPFDQFTIKQIAGDMLAEPMTDDLIATGFHRNTMLNEEGGIDPLEFRYHAMVDRVATTGTTWMGLTTGCAQCHTHKFDPLLHKEYFQLMAFLDNADEPDLQLRGPDWQQQREANLAEAAKLISKLPEKWPVEDTQWTPLRTARLTSENGETPRIMDDGSALFAAPGPAKDTYTFEFLPDGGSIDQIRLEALPDDSLPARGPGRVKHGNFVLSEIEVFTLPSVAGESPVRLKVASAEADVEQTNFPVSSAIDGKLDTGWAVDAKGKPMASQKTARFRLEKPLSFEKGAGLQIILRQQHGQHHTIGRVRLSAGRAIEGPNLAERRRNTMEDSFSKWLKSERERTVNWTVLSPGSVSSNLPLLKVEADGSIYVSGDVTKYDKYELNFTNLPPGVTAIRLEALADDRLPGRGPGLAYYEGEKGDFLLSDIRLFAGGQQLRFAKATESHAKGSNRAPSAIDDDLQTGWACTDRLGQDHQAAFLLAEPFAAGGHATLKLEFSRHYPAALGRFRIAVTTDARGGEARDIPAEIELLLAREDASLQPAERQQLQDHFLLTAPELAVESKRIRDLRRPPGAQTTLVLREKPPESPRVTRMHNRGEWLQPGDPVEPGVPAFLPGLPPGAPKNRLTFARWLVSPDNPLTARVVVNRQWEAFFGQGIVRTVADFGLQGEMPSDPLLLDWLAREFIRQGWSMKKLHRLIVTSATYRQDSTVTPAQLARDPQNRLLARGPRGRVDAELVRDIALRASGLLADKMYGPPVRPPQPDGITEVAFGNPKWNPSQGEDRYRRAVYTFVKRSAPYAMLNTFDAPSGEVCVARREVSNTPLQALTLLNDEVFLDAARAIGKRAAELVGDDKEKAHFIFRRFVARIPSEAETQRLVAFTQQQRERFKRGELDAKKLGQADSAEVAVWTVLARAVMNLDETISKN
jgi:hypothetical protein